MKDDFQIVRPPKAPFWRNSKFLPDRGVGRYALAVLSALCVVLVFVPPEQGYGEPISLQLARGHVAAWLLFCAMAVALAFLGQRLWRSERHFSSAFCYLTIGALAAIAATDPFSNNHLFVFVALFVALFGWLWTLYIELGEWKLLVSALACGAGCVSCAVSLGIGERLVVLSAIGGVNALFYEHVLY